MTVAINEHHSEKATAFAHCISEDFDDDQQMSAGVVVIFKNHFGKPSISNCINKHLAYQENLNEAGVYNLIMKKK